jgi:hypothetical protein
MSAYDSTEGMEPAIILVVAATGFGILGLGMEPDYVKISAAVFSGLSLLVGLWIAFGRDIRRRWLIRNPLEIQIIGDDGHSTDIVYVPAETTKEVVFRIVAKMNFREDELCVIIEGDSETRPALLNFTEEFVSEWIERPDSARSPKYRDIKGQLHLVRRAERVKGRTQRIGIKIQTRALGRYRMRFISYTDAGDYEIAGPTIVVTYARAAISSNDQT